MATDIKARDSFSHPVSSPLGDESPGRAGLHAHCGVAAVRISRHKNWPRTFCTQAQNFPTQVAQFVVMWGGVPKQKCVLYASNLCALCLSL